MVKGDIKYSGEFLLVNGELAGTVEKGEIVNNVGAGWVSATIGTLTINNVIAVAFEDGDSGDRIRLLRSGVIEVEKISGIAAYDGEIVASDVGILTSGGATVANACVVGDYTAGEVLACIKVW